MSRHVVGLFSVGTIFIPAWCSLIVRHYTNIFLTELTFACRYFVGHASCSHVLSLGCKRHRNLQQGPLGHGGGGQGGLQLWSLIYPQASAYETALVQVTSCPPPWQQERVYKSSLQQNLSSQDQVSTRPALTSPARCSCDLRALSAPHGGRRLHRVESMACRVGLSNVGYFQILFTLVTLSAGISHIRYWYDSLILLKVIIAFGM